MVFTSPPPPEFPLTLRHLSPHRVRPLHTALSRPGSPASPPDPARAASPSTDSPASHVHNREYVRAAAQAFRHPSRYPASSLQARVEWLFHSLREARAPSSVRATCRTDR